MSVSNRTRVLCPENHIFKEYFMKKIILPVIFAIAIAGFASAQGFGGPPAGPMAGPGAGRGPGFGPMSQNHTTPPAAPVSETLEGKLELVDATPAIKVGSKTYYVRLPGMLFGFIDGLKEGAQVKLEGYSFPIPAAKDSFVFHIQKLTLGGRTIDLSTGAMGRKGMPGQMGPGSCGQNGMRGKGSPRGNRRF